MENDPRQQARPAVLSKYSTAELAALQSALLRIPSAEDVRQKVQAEARARAAASEQRRVLEERLQDEDVAVAYSESLSPEGGTFAEYSPAWVRNPAFRRHADPVVESASLASVIPPQPTFRLRLPMRTIAQGRLSDVQLEAVLLACGQVSPPNSSLPPPPRASPSLALPPRRSSRRRPCPVAARPPPASPPPPPPRITPPPRRRRP
jgi:hypothetical protein